jgi:hypothetical protein
MQDVHLSASMRGVCNVYLKLAGHLLSEMPVAVDLGERQPIVGDLIEVPFGQRKVRARVSNAFSVGSRDGHVFFAVYAEEVP